MLELVTAGADEDFAEVEDEGVWATAVYEVEGQPPLQEVMVDVVVYTDVLVLDPETIVDVAGQTVV